jgi:hypothetical protein
MIDATHMTYNYEVSDSIIPTQPKKKSAGLGEQSSGTPPERLSFNPEEGGAARRGVGSKGGCGRSSEAGAPGVSPAVLPPPEGASPNCKATSTSTSPTFLTLNPFAA